MVQIREAVIKIDDDFIGPHIHPKILAAAAFSAEEALGGLVKKLGKGVKLTPKMIDDLIEETRLFVIALQSQKEETSEISQASSEALSPTWFEELKAKVESGEIPKYRGKRIDYIDPIAFTYKWYFQYINAGLLMQWHLRILDSNLIVHLGSHIRHEKLQKRLPEAYTVADVVPTSKKISDKLLLG